MFTYGDSSVLNATSLHRVQSKDCDQHCLDLSYRFQQTSINLKAESFSGRKCKMGVCRGMGAAVRGYGGVVVATPPPPPPPAPPPPHPSLHSTGASPSSSSLNYTTDSLQSQTAQVVPASYRQEFYTGQAPPSSLTHLLH